MRIGRVLDNQARTPAGEDALTVPELLGAVRESIWSELAAPDFGAGASDREPAISSTRRHLQGEHVRRLIELGTGLRWPGSAAGTIQSLARSELRAIDHAIERVSQRQADAATRAHLVDMRERIAQALEATYIRRD